MTEFMSGERPSALAPHPEPCQESQGLAHRFGDIQRQFQSTLNLCVWFLHFLSFCFVLFLSFCPRPRPPRSPLDMRRDRSVLAETLVLLKLNPRPGQRSAGGGGRQDPGPGAPAPPLSGRDSGMCPAWCLVPAAPPGLSLGSPWEAPEGAGFARRLG